MHFLYCGLIQECPPVAAQVLNAYDREEDAKAATGELLLSQLFAVLGECV